MNYRNILKGSLLMAAAALAATSCQEDITYGDLNAPEGASGESLIYVTDGDGNATGMTNVEFRNNKTISLFANTTSAPASAQSVEFSYDLTALDRYNKSTGNKFEAIPESMVTFSNGGVATVEAGQMKSSAVELQITSDGSLDNTKSYCIPVRISAVSSRASVASTSQTRLIFVRDLTSLPDCFKTWTDDEGVEHEGVKVFSCMEVNDTNPLNNLCYTLKNSGKYLVDALIIFSANINYNAETGRVYVFNNPNVQALLDGREHYLKPLKDRGMKIILGILGNHDRSAITNLAPETAKDFARELKAQCDAYDLDGVFWDDEYSEEIYPAPAGFVEPSNEAWCNLAWEFKNLCPDRWNIAYAYSSTSSAIEINGTQPGDYIDYALHDYGRSSDLSRSYPGMPKSNMGLYSQEFNQGRFAAETNLRNMRNNGYGSHMIFAMDPNRSNVARQENAMDVMCRAFYGDTLVVTKPYYPKDWN